MPDIPVSSQIFDIAFHPNRTILFAALLTGEVKAFEYDEEFRDVREEEEGGGLDGVGGLGAKGKRKGKVSVVSRHLEDEDEDELEGSVFAKSLFTVRPSKRSCRGIVLSADGGRVYAVGKGKAIYTIDIEQEKVSESRLGAHQAAINRVEQLMGDMLVTGDDDGVVKLWDTRRRDSVRSYEHHFDFVSDFMWVESAKHVVVTSGDGTLSVIDVKSSKQTPFAQSEDQEDELLSVVSIRGGSKTVVGTQLGILSVFNKNSGWGDCVDRIPGHPHSIDALCNLPSRYASAHSTILTGSSDGLLRAVQLFPTKLLGVVADHGEFPIERVRVDRGGEGMWVGSVGHDEVVRMTRLGEIFEDEGGESGSDGGGDSDSEGGKEFGLGVRVKGGVGRDQDGDSDSESGESGSEAKLSRRSPSLSKSKSESRPEPDSEEDEPNGESDADSSEEEIPKEKKRKRKEKDALDIGQKSRKKGRNQLVIEPSFFSGL